MIIVCICWLRTRRNIHSLISSFALYLSLALAPSSALSAQNRVPSSLISQRGLGARNWYWWSYKTTWSYTGNTVESLESFKVVNNAVARSARGGTERIPDQDDNDADRRWFNITTTLYTRCNKTLLRLDRSTRIPVNKTWIVVLPVTATTVPLMHRSC